MLLLRVTSNLISSPLKVLYNPKAFFTHAAWLHQGSPHCAIFPTAASRRSPGRVSVPMWPVILSDRLEIVAFTYQLIPSGHILKRILLSFPPQGSCGISSRFQLLSPSSGQFPRYYSPVRHSSSAKASFRHVTVRLACIKPAASVQSEP